MNPLLFEIQLAFKRLVFRNLRFFMFDLTLPIVFYLLFTRVMNTGLQGTALKIFYTTYLINMMAYSVLLAGVMTVANTLSDDRRRRFNVFIDLSPVSQNRYYANMIIVFLTLNDLTMLALGGVAFLANDVHFGWIVWLELLGVMPLLSLPIILIGMLIAQAGTSNVINLMSNLIVFPMAILSGLWWPIQMMPSWIQQIGKFLPTYQITNVLNCITTQQLPSLHAIIVLLIWTGLLLGIIDVLRRTKTSRELNTI